MYEELGKELNILEGHIGTVYSCNFSPCGQFIVSGSWDHTIRVWNGFDEEKLVKFSGKTS